MVVRHDVGAGHESSGEIIEVGEGVDQWKVGDRVASMSNSTACH